MNQLDILCFQISARTGSFSTAAQELLISQQAISKHIKSLESELGFNLFLRNYQNLVLTKAGERMLVYFSERQAMINSINDSFVLTNEIPEIKIFCTEWSGTPFWFRDKVKIFQKKYREINVFTYLLNHEDMLNSYKKIKPDYILTTSYGSRHLPFSLTIIKEVEVPLYFIGRKSIEHSYFNYSSLPFFTINSGENSEQEIRKRTYALGSGIDFIPDNIQTLDNMGSVFWNVLLQNGLTLTPDIVSIEKSNTSYTKIMSGLTATTVLGRTNIYDKECLHLFEQELSNESITD